MRYLPIELDVRGREVLAIGHGPELLSKVERALAAGARVTVVAEVPDDAAEALAREAKIQLERRVANDADLVGKLVVFLAPGDDALAARLFDVAARAGTLFCAVDRPESSTFVNPAVVEAGGLTIALGAGGKSPGVLARIREDLARVFSDERFGRFLDALAEARAKLPRGERARRMKAAVAEFSLEARLHFPAWFERGEEP